MAVTYEAIFLKWNGDTDHRAVLCFFMGHKDASQVQVSDMKRTLGTGELRGAISDSWVEWEGIIYLMQEPGTRTEHDGDGDVQVASSAELLSAFVANDLKAKFHLGTEYIEVRWVSPWAASLKYDPFGKHQELYATLWAI